MRCRRSRGGHRVAIPLLVLGPTASSVQVVRPQTMLPLRGEGFLYRRRMPNPPWSLLPLTALSPSLPSQVGGVLQRAQRPRSAMAAPTAWPARVAAAAARIARAAAVPRPAGATAGRACNARAPAAAHVRVATMARRRGGAAARRGWGLLSCAGALWKGPGGQRGPRTYGVTSRRPLFFFPFFFFFFFF